MVYGLNAYKLVDDAWETHGGGVTLVQVKDPPPVPKGEVPDPDIHTPIYCAFPAGRLVIELTPENEDEILWLHEGQEMTRAELVTALDALADKPARRKGAGMVERDDPRAINTPMSLTDQEELRQLRALKAQLESGNVEQKQVMTPDEFESQLHVGQEQCPVCGKWVASTSFERHCYLSVLNGKNLPGQHKAFHKERWPETHAKAKWTK